MTEETTAKTSADEFVVPDGFEDISGDAGVYKRVIKEGEGEERPGDNDTVFVHYTGTLYGGSRDGEKFDSSRDRGEPFSFKLGSGQVIKGWDKAVATMRANEECDIVLKPNYAYGPSGSGASIPPNACLKFNIQLLRWEGEDVTEAKDNGVVKSRIAKGEGYANPNTGSQVSAKLTGYCNGKQFESREASFEIGVGEDSGIVEGVEIGLRSMTKGERARLRILPKYAFGSAGSQANGVPPDAVVEYVVELLDFEKVKESWELSEEEKVQQAELLKAKGTEYFKRGKFKPALSYYDRAIEHLKWDSSFEDKPEELRNQRLQLLLAGRLNASLMHCKLGDYHKCIEEADEALKLDSKSSKAYFRRGQARMALRDFEEAKADFEEVARIEPGNRAAQQQAAAARQKIVEERQKQKKTFYGMFDKFAKADSAAKPAAAAQQQENGADKKDGDQANAEAQPSE